MKKIIIIFTLILSVVLFDSNVLAYEEYNVGDKIKYKNEDYYVIANSDSNTDYVTLLKSNALTIEELYKYGRDENDHLFINEYSINSVDPEKVVYDYSDGTGGIAYYTSETCMKEYSWNGSILFGENYINSKCTTSYDESDIKKVLNNWYDDKFKNDELVDVKGYKVRLITLEELSNNLGYGTSDKPKTFAYSVDYNYWTMSSSDDDNIGIVLGKKKEPEYKPVNNTYAVRPVINLSKKAIGDSDVESSVCNTEKVTKYKLYKIGDEVEYKGEKYYVIEKSNKKQRYVTLLKDQYLTYDQLKEYVETSNIKNNNYYIQYETVYDNDKIMKILNNWVSKSLQEEDLVEVDGYKVRIINENDLITNLGCSENRGRLVNGEVELESYRCSSDNIDWLFNYSAWTMITGYNEDNFKITRDGEVELEPSLSYKLAIRPVINVKKEKVSNKESYSIGDIVTYQHDDYYVINNVKEEDEYITLLKAIPLNNFEISTTNYYYLPYYIDGNCDNTSTSGCTTEYNKSYIKSVIDFWKDKFLSEEDLVEVNGYKARLLTTEEAINNLGYDFIRFATSYDWWKTDDTPDWAYSNTYWSMSPFEDSSYFNNTIGTKISKEQVYNLSLVRPVINLDKCALEGGCWEEENQGCIGENVAGAEDSKTIVNTGNTLKTTSTIILIVSIILIVCGIGILLFNYNKSKKEKKSIKK